MRLSQQSLSVIAPPKRLTVSEWADETRVLSPEASAESGKWNTSRAEYQRGIMDAFTDPKVETIVWLSSAQVGKTELLLNVIGYFIDKDPSTILLLQPTLEMAQTFFETIRDCLIGIGINHNYSSTHLKISTPKFV